MQKLREMQPEDIKAVVQLIETHDEDDADEARESYQQIGGIMDQYVLEQNGQVIGVTGFLTPPGCDETHVLSWTYVHDDYTNQGHGRIMLNELIAFLKEQGGRKVFVRVSDYVDDEDGAIYAAALHVYQSLGFKLEITHKDYYDDGEAQMILGLRLKEAVNVPVEQEHCPVQFNSVFEIAETDDAYSFGWHDESESLFNVADVEIGLEQVRKDEGRAVFLSFPSNYAGVADRLLASGFTNTGTLDDYFEDGIHEQHFAYRF